jgi:hypothetical protein
VDYLIIPFWEINKKIGMSSSSIKEWLFQVIFVDLQE